MLLKQGRHFNWVGGGILMTVLFWPASNAFAPCKIWPSRSLMIIMSIFTYNSGQITARFGQKLNSYTFFPEIESFHNLHEYLNALNKTTVFLPSRFFLKFRDVSNIFQMYWNSIQYYFQFPEKQWTTLTRIRPKIFRTSYEAVVQTSLVDC